MYLQNTNRSIKIEDEDLDLKDEDLERFEFEATQRFQPSVSQNAIYDKENQEYKFNKTRKREKNDDEYPCKMFKRLSMEENCEKRDSNDFDDFDKAGIDPFLENEGEIINIDTNIVKFATYVSFAIEKLEEIILLLSTTVRESDPSTDPLWISLITEKFTAAKESFLERISTFSFNDEATEDYENLLEVMFKLAPHFLKLNDLHLTELLLETLNSLFFQNHTYSEENGEKFASSLLGLIQDTFSKDIPQSLFYHISCSVLAITTRVGSIVIFKNPGCFFDSFFKTFPIFPFSDTFEKFIVFKNIVFSVDDFIQVSSKRHKVSLKDFPLLDNYLATFIRLMQGSLNLVSFSDDVNKIREFEIIMELAGYCVSHIPQIQPLFEPNYSRSRSSLNYVYVILAGISLLYKNKKLTTFEMIKFEEQLSLEENDKEGDVQDSTNKNK